MGCTMTQLKHIDLEHGKKVVGDEDIARNLLKMLIDNLPKYLSTIQSSRSAKSWQQLGDDVHGLKGATCYTSTPRLHESTTRLNQALSAFHGNNCPNKDEMNGIDQLLSHLYNHADELIEFYAQSFKK